MGLAVSGKVMESVLRSAGGEAIKEGFLEKVTPAPAPLLPRDSGVLVVLGLVGEKQLLLSKCNGCFLYGQESKPAVSYTIRSYRV